MSASRKGAELGRLSRPTSASVQAERKGIGAVAFSQKLDVLFGEVLVDQAADVVFAKDVWIYVAQKNPPEMAGGNAGTSQRSPGAEPGKKYRRLAV